MLRDSAHIQEFEAEWKNRKGKRSGAEPVEPMYTVQDAEAACRLFRGVEYGKRIELAPGIEARFVDVGHLLGSASIELWITEGSTTTKLVFSGDIGNLEQPIIKARYIEYRITDGTFYLEDTVVFVCSPSLIVMLGKVLPVAVENIKGVFGDKIITAVMISDCLYVGYQSGIWSFQRNITDSVE